MNISELKSGQGNVDIEVVVKSKDEPRSFNKYGRELRVCNLVVSDDSGEIKMSLWNDDIDKVKVGDKIKLTNGYVSEFNGEKQLTSGKFGKFEVVGSEPSESGEERVADESSGEEGEDSDAKKESSGEEEMPM